MSPSLPQPLSPRRVTRSTPSASLSPTSAPQLLTSALPTQRSKPVQRAYRHVRALCPPPPSILSRRSRAAVKTTESILSAITTGWLSHLSDLYGRKKILGFSIFGALFMCARSRPSHTLSVRSPADQGPRLHSRIRYQVHHRKPRRGLHHRRSAHRGLPRCAVHLQRPYACVSMHICVTVCLYMRLYMLIIP